MIRFIDMRGQDVPFRFAYFDTVTDLFTTANGTIGWDTFADFEEDADPGTDVERFRRVTPEWAFKEP